MFFLQILLNSMVHGTQVFLLSLCLFLIYQVGKMFHVAVGAIGMTSAYMFYAGANQGSILLGITYALITAIILGILSDLLLKGLIEKDQNLLALMVSFSIGIILESSISIIFSTSAKRLSTGPLINFKFFHGLHISLPGILILGFGTLVFLILFLAFKYTPIGRNMRSVAENKYVVLANGVNPTYLRLGTFILASILVSVITILSGYQNSLSPLMGFPLVVSAFVVLLVGGLSDIRGLVVATFILIIVPQIFLAYSSGLSSSWERVILFGLAAICLLWKPNGLFSNLTREQ